MESRGPPGFFLHGFRGFGFGAVGCSGVSLGQGPALWLHTTGYFTSTLR